ncbi:hypothetical protein CAEBREN_24001 [Caenorhabditis brenneri]|uniref:Uncharacterized protein n=1 Tax=Caenorhabditis brenneri TaxID=135651 RepID=G0NJ09_CAEBE|nr:hypothetical protein CAEBREN_24001 [Caenorhabditis brenneri]
MDLFKSVQFKSVIKEIIQESLQPLEEKLEKRLRILEKVINDKADQEEEAVPTVKEEEMSLMLKQ